MAAGSAALMLALSGCGQASGQTPASTSVSTGTGTSSPPSASATTGGPSATATVIPPSTSAPGAEAGGLCSAAMLSGKADDAGGAGAGQVYLKLMVTNTSPAMCVLDGYPGVSLVAGATGAQLGAPADRDTDHPSAGPINLAPGATATAQLHYSQAANYQGCTVVQAAGIRLYPPSATDALYLPHPLASCTEAGIVFMHIGAFAAS
jgi:hypothetical protein